MEFLCKKKNRNEFANILLFPPFCVWIFIDISGCAEKIVKPLITVLHVLLLMLLLLEAYKDLPIFDDVKLN